MDSVLDSNKATVIKRLLEDARKKLVETGTRNRLIHVNLENKRQNALAIVNERSDDLFEILKVKLKKMRFQPLGKDDADEDDTPLLTIDVHDAPFDEGRYTDNLIETPLNTDKLQKRLLRLARDAKSAEEEQGVNILYLALGFLTWYEDKASAVKRQAPLILLPVSLERNARTSTYDVVCRDDDLVTNLPLQERLKEDFGIELPLIEEIEGWRPSAYFDLIRPIIADRPNWKVCDDDMQLGFFSFAKLLMLRDLDPDNWPDATLTDHDLLNGVLVDGFEHDTPIFGDHDKLDKLLEPENIIQVVDADASQTKVIEEVRAGRSLVVQGPPGTGKSQTITNIIAAAVHDGKSVLFVAEKMAALSVVHQRLVKCDLSDICLELHSKSANKKAVLAELSRTLNAGRAIPSMPPPPDELVKRRNTLNNISELLHRNVPEHDYSAFSVMSKIVGLIGRDAKPPQIKIDALSKLKIAEIKTIGSQINDFCDLVEKYGISAKHPFIGTQNLSLTPTDLQRLSAMLADLRSKADELDKALEQAANFTGLTKAQSNADVVELIRFLQRLDDAPDATTSYLHIVGSSNDHGRLIEALTIASDWKASKAEAEQIVRDDCWDNPYGEHRSALVSGTSSFFARLGPKYRKASSALKDIMIGDMPKDAASRLRIIENVIAVQKLRRALDDEEPYLKSVIAGEWRGERTPFADMRDVSVWHQQINTISGSLPTNQIMKLLEAAEADTARADHIRTQLSAYQKQLKTIVELLKLDHRIISKSTDSQEVKFKAVGHWLDTLIAAEGRYGEWVSMTKQAAQLNTQGLTELVTDIESGALSSLEAATEFEYAVAEAQWHEAQQAFPKLEQLAQYNRQKLVDEYRQKDAERVTDTKTIVLARHLQQLPTGAVGEMKYIRGEIAKKQGHRSIRQLIENAGNMVQRIKPVFLMSPISVAQFLPPDKMSFDLLVIDEASQVRPEDALGAIVRAKQIVVVGDQKQLPPTSFFDRMTGSDETSEEDKELLGSAAQAIELESILSACEARGLRSRMLEWHYRSRDPSLIRVSNAEFYENNLVLPPSPLQEDDNYGLKFNKVPGVYSPGTAGNKGTGRPRTNKIEAQAVVDATARHARDWPDLSLGLVAFSVTQRDMITELLEHARRSDEILDSFLREGKREDVFVKNIENVQGDERDVIFISVGYGPHTANGRLASMSFGPVNREGGERRLNVLFSRSRVRCEVFASFDPSDMDLSKTQKNGPRVFKRFLEFAKTGQMDEKAPTGLLADSPFEIDVAEVVGKLGYEVDYQVGSGGFKIDLGVRHPERPGQYMLAIECDGATYHSALWARERDRLRQAVLEGLGWKFYRIWSTDWFHRRSAEIDRLKATLSDVQYMHADGIRVSGANEGYEVADSVERKEPSEPATEIPTVELTSIKAQPYERSHVSVSGPMEPHEVPHAQLAPIVLRIIQDEGPVHKDEIARRLASAFGKQRVGARIQNTSESVLSLLRRTHTDHLVENADFWFTKEQNSNPPIRDRSEESGALLKAEMIPPMEIKAASERIIAESGQVGSDDLVQAVSYLLGYKRLGPELRAYISQVLSSQDKDPDC